MDRVRDKKMTGVYRSLFFCMMILFLACSVVPEGWAASKNVKQKTFNSAADAAEALFNAAKAEDNRQIDAIFGP
jgi:hypothetical protein